jgi:hypothetical protein
MSITKEELWGYTGLLSLEQWNGQDGQSDNVEEDNEEQTQQRSPDNAAEKEHFEAMISFWGPH